MAFVTHRTHYCRVAVLPAIFVLLHCSARTGLSQESLFDGVWQLFGGAAQPAAIEVFGDINVDPLFQNQFVPVLRSILSSELRYVRKVCQPTGEQMKLIQEAGLAEVDVLAKKCAAIERGNHHPRRWPNAREFIAAALEKKVAEIVSADVASKYRDELAARKKARQQAVLGMMMAKLDRQLVFSPDQYEEVQKAIEEHWKEEWEGSLQTFMYEEYAPVPDNAVLLPILNEQQQVIWNARTNYGQISFGWQTEIGGVFAGHKFGGEEDELPPVEEASEAPMPVAEVLEAPAS